MSSAATPGSIKCQTWTWVSSTCLLPSAVLVPVASAVVVIAGVLNPHPTIWRTSSNSTLVTIATAAKVLDGDYHLRAHRNAVVVW
ncbi:hypothetical protein EDD16DRAFT_1615190 [Pisolithus croceorrhizus]|nr:hypothetical protein EDD16DRAFT_1615190 [Pisolithus croceorrhizus]